MDFIDQLIEYYIKSVVVDFSMLIKGYSHGKKLYTFHNFSSIGLLIEPIEIVMHELNLHAS